MTATTPSPRAMRFIRRSVYRREPLPATTPADVLHELVRAEYFDLLRWAVTPVGELAARAPRFVAIRYFVIRYGPGDGERKEYGEGAGFEDRETADKIARAAAEKHQGATVGVFPRRTT